MKTSYREFKIEESSSSNEIQSQYNDLVQSMLFPMVIELKYVNLDEYNKSHIVFDSTKIVTCPTEFRIKNTNQKIFTFIKEELYELCCKFGEKNNYSTVDRDFVCITLENLHKFLTLCDIDLVQHTDPFFYKSIKDAKELFIWLERLSELNLDEVKMLL